MRRACLWRCRNQGQLRAARSVGGWADALTAGVRSGGWFVGSSCALMAGLFALGVMSVTWMVLVAALVACEKLAPWPRGATLGTAVVLLVLAAAMATAPEAIPGLVIPASGSAM